MSHNGWKNSQTWATALWIDNDESTYSYVREIASEIVAADDEKPAVYELSDRLRDFVRDQMLPELDGLASDLLSSAVSEIDYDEIAKGIISELDDE